MNGEFKRQAAGQYIAKFRGYEAVVSKLDDTGRWEACLFSPDQDTEFQGVAGTMKEAQALIYDIVRDIKIPVRNIMTGKEVQESIATPWSCSVASETYFCS